MEITIIGVSEAHFRAFLGSFQEQRAGSTDEDLTLASPGLPLVAEISLSGSDVLKLGGASRENPDISEGFHGLGFTVGELAREAAGFLDVVVADLVPEGEYTDLTGGTIVFVVLDTEAARRVGVAAFDVDFDVVTEALLVGVEDRALDLAVGVEDLGGTVGFAEGMVAREVGVADLDDLDAVVVDIDLEVALDAITLVAAADVDLDAEVEVDLDKLKAGLPLGVECLDPPEEDGLRRLELEVFNPGEEASCLDAKLLLEVASGREFVNCIKVGKLQIKIYQNCDTHFRLRLPGRKLYYFHFTYLSTHSNRQSSALSSSELVSRHI
ncbi:hypothetical protein KY284_016601 [Solanum tuberosum]|nr:hypothetical protein KY284_016601 [Solanum tuberosum]